MSSVMSHSHLALDIELPWNENRDQHEKFKRLTQRLVGPFMALLLIMPFLPDLSGEPEVAEKVVTQVILEPPKVIEEDVPKPVEIPKQRTQNQRPDAVPKVGTQTGTETMAALSKQLSSLRSSLDMSQLQKKNVVQSDSGQAQKSTRALLGKDSANRSSGGLKASDVTVNAKGAALSEHKGTDIEMPSMAMTNPDRAEYQYDPNRKSKRDMESIRRVVERFKGSVYSIYNKALRSNPDLSGKFVFGLTIHPDGSVTDVKVVASDLGDKKLEQEILKKIATIRFSPQEVDTTALEWTYHFIPS